MPIFIVEREFAEGFDPDEESIRLVDQYHDDHDIKWFTSFLSADKKKTYCLYECRGHRGAPSPRGRSRACRPT